MDKNHVVVGMAGHIDHGKTSLVKCLTGTDTDRLKEEKERGITTDLGFAFLGMNITIIDVPGHEKFVKNMVAGVNTIDMAILVIAADDGVMPQTVEHLEILNLLQIKRGIVALNKIDKVEPDWVELVEVEIASLLKGTSIENAPIVRVSAHTDTGIDILKSLIVEMASKIPPRPDSGLFRMFIDRVFVLKGVGTIVAGTVLSGSVKSEDAVEIQPHGISTKIKKVQMHDNTLDIARAGFRAALNLQGVQKDTVNRGDVVAEPGFCHPTSMFNARFVYLKSSKKEIKNRTRIRVNVGTGESIARLHILGKEAFNPGDEGFVQIRFESPVVVQSGDRFIVRSYSPVFTIGGGAILDVHPAKYKKKSDSEVILRLEKIFKGDPSQSVLKYLEQCRFEPKNCDEIAKALSMTIQSCSTYMDTFLTSEEIVRVSKEKYITSANYDLLKKKYISILEQYFQENAFKSSVPAEHVRTSLKIRCDKLLSKVIFERLEEDSVIRLNNGVITPLWHKVVLTDAQKKNVDQVLKKLQLANLSPPSKKELEAELGRDISLELSLLLDNGQIIAFDETVFFTSDAAMKAMDTIVAAFKNENENIPINIFREMFEGLSRKFVILILEFSDKIGQTIKVGEGRILNNPSAFNQYMKKHEQHSALV